MTVIKINKTTKKDIVNSVIDDTIEFTAKASAVLGIPAPEIDREAVFVAAEKQLTMSEEDAIECYNFLNSSKFRDYKEQIKKVTSTADATVAHQIVLKNLELLGGSVH